MTIGGGITLAAIGAILAFALTFEVAGIDIALIGYILIVAGILVILFGLFNRRTTVTERPVTERSVERPVARERVVERDRDVI